MAEAQHTPDAILGPLLAICRSAADKCIGDYRSSFVDLLLFVLRLTTRFRAMVVWHQKQLKEQQEQGKILREIQSFLVDTASPLLVLWSKEAFAVRYPFRCLFHVLFFRHVTHPSPDRRETSNAPCSSTRT